MSMTFIEHVRQDVLSWPQERREKFSAAVAVRHTWSDAEAELRAWVDLREGPEPVVLNRHHLTPRVPQHDSNQVWPQWAVYCGRVPVAASDPEPWLFARALHNPWAATDFPDALERYRMRIKDAMMKHAKGVFHPMVDAIASLLPRHALVCSCVQTPWVPTTPIDPQQPLGSEWKCHCQLVVVAWRALRRKAAANREPAKT